MNFVCHQKLLDIASSLRLSKLVIGIKADAAGIGTANQSSPPNFGTGLVPASDFRNFDSLYLYGAAVYFFLADDDLQQRE